MSSGRLIQLSKCWTAAVRTPYLGHLAAAVRGGVAGTKRVAGRARAAGLAVRPLAAVVRVVLAGCVSDLVPPSVVVVSAVRGDFSPCCNKVTRCQKHMTCTRTAPLKKKKKLKLWTRTWCKFACHARARVTVPAGCSVRAPLWVAHTHVSHQVSHGTANPRSSPLLKLRGFNKCTVTQFHNNWPI